MNINQFWHIIDTGKDSDKPEAILKTELEKLAPQDIELFQNHIDKLFDKAYLWDLWGAAYMIGGGCSDDGFMEFRYALISMGRDVFEKAISNPDSLAELGGDLEIDNELFGYVAQEVYKNKTGKEIPRRGGSSFEEYAGEEWDFEDEEENNKRIPNLAKLYW